MFKSILSHAKWLVFLLPISSHACFVQPAPWGWEDSKLVACTKNIFIGKFDGRDFEVQKNLKGKYPVKSKVQVKSKNINEEDVVGIAPDCSLTTGFKKGISYIVFHHAHTPKGYQLHSSQWEKQIMKLTKAKYKLSAPCEEVSKDYRP